MLNAKDNFRRIILLISISMVMGFFLLTGCGSPPGGPEIQPGYLEIWAYFDSSWTDPLGVLHPDSVLVPAGDTIIVQVDDDSSRIYIFTVNPAILTDILPGVHKIDLSWGEYNTSFSSNIIDAETTSVSPKMTQFAPDFTLPGMYFDLAGDTLVQLDSVTLSDYRGEVVLLFFFNAG